MRVRLLLSSAALAAVCLVPIRALAQGTTASVCTDGSTSASTGRGTCSGHGGVDAKATAAAKKAASTAKNAKTVTCTDGSTSKGGRGACSSHGGIAKGKSAATPAPAPAPAPA